MSELIYQSSKPVFIHNLKNLAGILKTAQRHARARNIDPGVFLTARLAPDMHPLVRQVQMATDHAKGCCSRLAGVETPSFADVETTFPELEARIQNTLDFLGELRAKQFVGAEGREILMQFPIGTIRFNGLDYLNGFALPNFYFHCCAAYNILRHNGVDIGKRDFLGAVPRMEMKGKIAKVLGAKPRAKRSKKR